MGRSHTGLQICSKFGQSRQQRWNVGFSFTQGKTVTTKEVLQKDDDINPFNFSFNELVSPVSQTLTIVKHIEKAVGTHTHTQKQVSGHSQNAPEKLSDGKMSVSYLTVFT